MHVLYFSEYVISTIVVQYGDTVIARNDALRRYWKLFFSRRFSYFSLLFVDIALTKVLLLIPELLRIRIVPARQDRAA